METFNEPSGQTVSEVSDLYNSMIYPFMRTVIYGVIWYQGIVQIFLYYKFTFSLINKGEENTVKKLYGYACKFAKMIHYWRQIWNNRTNGITDIQFPFGFVQVSFTENILELNSFIENYLQTIDIFIVSDRYTKYQYSWPFSVDSLGTNI